MMQQENEKTLFYHGTKAALQKGDLLRPGFRSNYQEKSANHIYFSATLDAAIWGAELAVGEGSERIYIVEPQGHYEDDPNLTDKKFPGNPTKSYRSRGPLLVVGEVKEWQGHTAEQLTTMKNHLAAMRVSGEMVIDD